MPSIEQLIRNREIFPAFPMVQRSYERTLTEGMQLIRAQIANSPTQFSVLLKHPESKHWCGYALVPYSRYKVALVSLTDFERAGVPISYIGFSTDQICWMDATTRGDLRHPVNLLDPGQYPEGDFWIGFDFQLAPNMLESTALQYMDVFTSLVQRYFFNDDSGVHR